MQHLILGLLYLIILWVTENFFEYNNKNFLEIGIYYKVSTESGFGIKSEAFYGEEGDRLLYQWVLINKLSEMLLYPEFLKTSLNRIPDNIEHLIIGAI